MKACKVTYLDEQLPPVGEEILWVVVEVDHFKSTKSKLRIRYDFGGIFSDGTTWTENDWDEGQPWAIVGWLQFSSKNKMKKYKRYAPVPSEEEIRKHKINWRNEIQPKIDWKLDYNDLVDMEKPVLLYLNINKNELPNDGKTREENHRLKQYYVNFEVEKKNYEIQKNILEPMLTNGLDYKKLTEDNRLIEFREWAIRNCTTYNKGTPDCTTVVEKEDIKRYMNYKEYMLVHTVEIIKGMEDFILEKRAEYAKNRHNTEIH